jgi:hypothetical protein
MKKMLKNLSSFITMALSVIVLLVGSVILVAGTISATAQASQAEQASKTMTEFDTSVLQTWCHGEGLGTVRMVGGVVHERTGDVWTLHDEQGNAWTVEDLHNMQEHGWMLLWIADNNTTDDVTDDTIVKLWTEVY